MLQRPYGSFCERNAVRNSSTLCISNEIDGICMIPYIVCRVTTTVDGIIVLWCCGVLDVFCWIISDMKTFCVELEFVWCSHSIYFKSLREVKIEIYCINLNNFILMSGYGPLLWNNVFLSVFSEPLELYIQILWGKQKVRLILVITLLYKNIEFSL